MTATKANTTSTLPSAAGTRSETDERARAREEIRIGISSCLLGARVRFDGEHKLDRYIKQTVGQFVKFVPICPEVDIGLGIPRETIRLERTEGEIRLVAPKSGLDHTDAMRRYARRKSNEIEKLDLSGYILKKNSPSCGMERVKVYDGNGSPSKVGVGLFAEGLLERHPLLPVEEEGRLNDPKLRENFFERVFAYRRVQDLFRGRWRVGDLVRFHSAEKFLLLAHDTVAYRSLGRLVARAKSLPRAEVASRYPEGFLRALAHQATRRTHANVLQHMAGYFKKRLDADGKREIQHLITDFRRGLVPLIVPITLVRHYVRLYDVDYLADQTYLDPHPKELMLRNHV